MRYNNLRNQALLINNLQFEQVFRTHSSRLIDSRDSSGNTMLIIATQAANIELVDLILSKGPDINAQNVIYLSA